MRVLFLALLLLTGCDAVARPDPFSFGGVYKATTSDPAIDGVEITLDATTRSIGATCSPYGMDYEITDGQLSVVRTNSVVLSCEESTAASARNRAIEDVLKSRPRVRSDGANFSIETAGKPIIVFNRVRDLPDE